MVGLRSVYSSRRLAWGPQGPHLPLPVIGVHLQLHTTARSNACTAPAAQPEESTSSAESGDAPAPADKKESSGLMGVFGAMAAVMVVVVAFYSVAFVAGGAMLLQFKDQIGSVTKKDFVPYSERRAMEQQLLQERMDAGEADVQDTAQAGARGIDRDFLTLMPLE